MDTAYLSFLESLGGAIAVIENGAIAWCSKEALSYGVMVGAPLELLLPVEIGQEELSTVRQISLPNLGKRVYARVCATGAALVLALREDSTEVDSNALARTSRMLRIPLNEIMSTSKRLFERLEDMEDPVIQTQTASLNRGFYQLLRTASAISDLQQEEQEMPIHTRRVELKGWLERVMQPAISAVDTTGRTLQLALPDSVLLAQIDAAALEKALWCLLSNAVRYSPEGSVITLRLQKQEGHCLFTMCNPVTQPVQLSDLSGGFGRPLTVEAGDSGLGLGLLRVQRIVRQHGGILLLSCTPRGDFSASFRLPACRPNAVQVRSALQTEELGGFSRMLVELADVLPDEVYDSRNF
ncbi:MAG: HAMP domain-containing histidine kinase [Ruminococcaceae bacterium]|nr:HAMP domain-containing histidine kinase [Oscillospiraceae bacterium]